MFYIMAMNKEISSILLLVVIGFAIYCLCNTKSVSGMANVASYIPEESEPLMTESEKLEIDSEPIENESETPPSPESIVPEMVQNASEVEPNTEVNTTVSENDIQEILDSSCGPNLPSADSATTKPSPNGISSFSPSSQGANIASAFNNPLPDGTRTDQIDFKNNSNKQYKAADYLPDNAALENIPKDKRFEGDFGAAKYKVGDNNLIPIQQFTIGAESGTSGSHKGSWWGLRGVAGVTNPRIDVGIWNNSTRVPDNNRKALGC